MVQDVVLADWLGAFSEYAYSFPKRSGAIRSSDPSWLRSATINPPAAPSPVASGQPEGTFLSARSAARMPLAFIATTSVVASSSTSIASGGLSVRKSSLVARRGHPGDG